MNEDPAMKYFCINPVLGRQVRKPTDTFSYKLKEKIFSQIELLHYLNSFLVGSSVCFCLLVCWGFLNRT